MRRGGNRASLVQAVCHDPRPMHFLMWGITCSDASASELRSLQVSSDGPAPSPVFLCLARHAHDRWFVAQQCSGTSDLDLHGTGKFGSPLNARTSKLPPKFFPSLSSWLPAAKNICHDRLVNFSFICLVDKGRCMVHKPSRLRQPVHPPFELTTLARSIRHDFAQSLTATPSPR